MNNKLMKKLEKYDTTMLADGADRFISLDSKIKPINSSMRCYGYAYTVKLEYGDSSIIFDAIDKAQIGDVLVIDTNNNIETAVWGDTKSLAAKFKGLGGVVIDGSYRDYSGCLDIGFPVFAKELVIHGSGNKNLGELNIPIKINDIEINPGDIVFGDENGVIIIDYNKLEEYIYKAENKKSSDKIRKEKIIKKYSL